MNRLHLGHRARLALALAALLVPLVGAGQPAAAAAAASMSTSTSTSTSTPTATSEDVVGGPQLAATHRTVSPGPGAQPLPDVWAETWIVADATTGAVLAHKGAHVPRPPASTIKTLTALTVLPRTSPEQLYVATPRAAGTYGARVGLRPGKSYTLDQLWYAVFLPSANDAALAVAQANGGIRRTVTEMNATAAELNARDTVVRNPTGLDAPGQVSSAYDLALIARAGMARADFARYAGTARATFPNVRGKGTHPIYTTNRLLLHGWKGMIGVKTGFTTHAGRTYVGAAKRHGRTLVVALMGIHESSESAARKLLTWGFANADKVTPVGQLVAPGPLEPVPANPSTGTPAPTAAGSSTTGGGPDASAAGPGTASAPLSGPVVLAGVGLAAAATTVVVLTGRRRHRPASGRHAAEPERAQ